MNRLLALRDPLDRRRFALVLGFSPEVLQLQPKAPATYESIETSLANAMNPIQNGLVSTSGPQEMYPISRTSTSFLLRTRPYGNGTGGGRS